MSVLKKLTIEVSFTQYNHHLSGHNLLVAAKCLYNFIIANSGS